MKETKTALQEEVLRNVVCPRDYCDLHQTDCGLRCDLGHTYPVIQGVPVLLVSEQPQTLWVAETSIKCASPAERTADDPFFTDSLGLTAVQREEVRRRIAQGNGAVDQAVSYLVGATSGFSYKHLVGALNEYPIPDLRLSRAGGAGMLLDIGCNWGRWCIAASKRGYSPIGLDPSLGAVLAAKRVAAHFSVDAGFIVGDARFLPFRPKSFDVVFSYSVLQHLSPADATMAIGEIGRVLKVGGQTMVQMPTTFGLRCLFNQARRRFVKPTGFDVRFWTVPKLKMLFDRYIGRTVVSVDCFFGIGLQPADLRLMPPAYKALIRSSEALRKLSQWMPWLCYIADSVYVESTKTGSCPEV